VRPAGSGISRVAPFVPVALLLHLAVALVAVLVCRRNGPRPVRPLPLTVEFTETAGIAQMENRQTAPEKAYSVPPAALTAGRRETSHPSPSPGPGPTARAPAGEHPRQAQSPAPEPPTPAAAIAGADSGSLAVETVFPRGRGEETGDGATATSGRPPGPDGKAAKGSGGTGGRTPMSDGAGAYVALLRRLVEAHKEYPFASRRARQEGSCQRRFTLGAGGVVKKIEPLSSCGHPFLDDAATRAISAVGRFPPLPARFGGKDASFTVTITFTLKEQ
jgi:periplasmic protein TonB